MQRLFTFANTFLCPLFHSGIAGTTSLKIMKTTYPKPSLPIRLASDRPSQYLREEGSWKTKTSPTVHPLPSRPDPKKIALAVAPIMRGASPDRISALNEIARLSGERPEAWEKPRFGDFEYWLAHQCGWIDDEELKSDTAQYQAKSKRALETSHRFSTQRFSWLETPRHQPPRGTGEYVPEMDMKLVKDRNLTDSARRIAMFVLRHVYQDNRTGRFIGMTVTFIMKGLSISRRTVQRSLTLLETQGYFRCEVAKGDATRMCIGLIIHLKESLFPKHHKDRWPEKRRNSEASKLSNKQNQIKNTIYNAKNKTSRLTWALKCMNGVARRVFKADPIIGEKQTAQCWGFKTLGSGFLHPAIRTQMLHSQA